MPKLILRVKTLGKNAGEEIEVSDRETADYLIANGHATAAPRKSSSSSDLSS
jgi:hypothetical protein